MKRQQTRVKIKKPSTDIFEDIINDVLGRYRQQLTLLEVHSGRKISSLNDVIAASKLIFGAQVDLYKHANAEGLRAVNCYNEHKIALRGNKKKKVKATPAAVK